jgi:hypothetical protein
MAVTGQTIAERAIAEGAVTAAMTDHVAVTGGVALIDTLVDTIIADRDLHPGRTYQAPDDAETGFTVTSFDNAPSFAPFAVEKADGSVLADIDDDFNSAAEGYISAINVLPAKLWVTADQTEPAWSNGQFWLRPRV